MIRALDFTAEPDNTYRYRVRIVVVQPQLQPRRRQPGGIDNKTKQDARGPLEQGNRRRDHAAGRRALCHRHAAAARPRSATKVRFQVVRFNPADGWTVPHRFDRPASAT